MTVQSTSLKAYKEEVAPHLGDKQLKVYVAIQMAKRPLNNQEIASHLGWPINSTTPRCNELVEMGKVELAFKAKYPATGRTVCYWTVKEN